MTQKNTRSTKLVKPNKPSGDPSAKPKRALVPQPHGGALLPGAGGGPQPGSGRRPDHVRQLATDLGYEEAIPALRKIVADPGSTKGEITSACKAILDLVPRKDEGALTKAEVEVMCQAYASQLDQIVQQEAPDALERIRARLSTITQG